MPNDLEKRTDFEAGNDSMVAQAEHHVRQAVSSLKHAALASRHERHEHQADALEALCAELEAKATLLGKMRNLKDAPQDRAP